LFDSISSFALQRSNLPLKLDGAKRQADDLRSSKMYSKLDHVRLTFDKQFWYGPDEGPYGIRVINDLRNFYMLVDCNRKSSRGIAQQPEKN
jgi:hypothetical protein